MSIHGRAFDVRKIEIYKSAKLQKFYKKRAKALKINTFALKFVREMSPESTSASTCTHGLQNFLKRGNIWGNKNEKWP